MLDLKIIDHKRDACGSGVLLVGIVAIIAGIGAIFYVIKYPVPKEKDTNKYNFQLMVSGLGFIILGIVLIYRELVK